MKVRSQTYFGGLPFDDFVICFILYISLSNTDCVLGKMSVFCEFIMHGKRKLHRRQWLACAAAALPFLVGCQTDGNFRLFGYTTEPRHETAYKRIYIPRFRNEAFQTTPYRNIEDEIHRTTVNAIESQTPWKVTHIREQADTELLGTVLNINKIIQNRDQLNQIREADIILGMELVWRDLRTGRILSNPRPNSPVIPVQELPIFDRDNPPPPLDPDRPKPVLIRAHGRTLPEVGESNATAAQRIAKNLANQIVNLLEKPWDVTPPVGTPLGTPVGPGPVDSTPIGPAPLGPQPAPAPGDPFAPRGGAAPPPPPPAARSTGLGN
jgi:hypothetical protein